MAKRKKVSIMVPLVITVTGPGINFRALQDGLKRMNYSVEVKGAIAHFHPKHLRQRDLRLAVDGFLCDGGQNDRCERQDTRCNQCPMQGMKDYLPC